ANNAGHKVTLISASDMQPPIGVDFVGVESAKQMFETVKKFFKKCDCLIMAAAVSDYTPARTSQTKIKKDRSELVLKLKPTKDILAWAGKNKKKNQIVVGFALEDKALRTSAEKKLKQKNLDMIIANTPEAIAAEKSTVHIKTAGSKWLKIENKDKAAIAKKIVAMLTNI
ncbi:MAG: phosphopantothenoylcysteine decarboxylase domain-containing protein, partial [Planctomycetota bacterium]